MSHITTAQKGLAAVEAKKWDVALPLLSRALQTSPNPAWLIARSKALIGKGRYQEALDDANLAWHNAYERNKRPLISEANYRRAVAYFRLGQYANADACCVYAIRLIKGFPAVEKEDPAKALTDADGFYTMTSEDAQREVREEAQKDTPRSINKGMNALDGLDLGPKTKETRTASSLRFMILAAMERLDKNDPARKLTTKARPEQKDLAALEPAEEDVEEEEEEEEEKPAPVAKSTFRPAIQLRLQDFQSDAVMSVSIFSKGADSEKLKVEFKPFSVHLNAIRYPTGETRPFDLHLWGEIDPASSIHTVTPHKIELSLRKKTLGKWKHLKGTAKTPDESAADAESSKASEKAPEQPKAEEKQEPAQPTEPKKAEASNSAPQYPTSSRTGPKDWDKVGDDDEAEDTSDVNHFFKKLYQGATPEQQRAMMKSFTESNGTSLSTDWDDVKDRTVETVPPEGVEAKKWS
ncbi:Cochaperone protein [Fusarium piperis]|uniref:Cochaperone protein n=1 Tax=Fusarium piperis TaxID=1435070 RepID=A0A9W8WG56_9HYPO|nr:Cochaperone protein [Fusarium piperis]